MKYIEPEILAEIKQIDLLTYLERYDPQELVKVSGNYYSTRTHDSVRINNGIWKQYSSGTYGRSALDYLVNVEGMDFMKAAHLILDKTRLTPIDYSQVKQPKPPERKALLLPEPYMNNIKAAEYLMCREIDKDIIFDFMEKDLIYETHFYHADNDKTYKNIVFIGKDPGGMERYGSIRGIDTTYKGDIEGSDKHYSFRSLCDNRVMKTVHLFESAIDLLSYATHLKMYGNDYKSYDLLSLAGIYQPKKNISDSKIPVALTNYFDDNPNTEKVIFHLDNDKAGRIATKAITAAMPKEYEVVDRPPKHGKDYNDYLRYILKKQEKQQIPLYR